MQVLGFSLFPFSSRMALVPDEAAGAEDEQRPATGHQPVLLEEALTLLRPEAGGRFVDATFGGGGHTRALLEAHSDNSVTALDCDPEAEARAADLAERYPERLRFMSLNFEYLDALPKESFDGVLFDLGVSSFHFDTPERGFSFRFDAPTDMRLDPRLGQTAAQFLETATREELVRAVRDLGEEPRWRRVVERLLQARGTGELRRTSSLAALVAEVADWGPRGRPGLHPATRTFQGLRMAVNRELEVLETALPKAFALLKPGGRLVVITFHSLEDRLVKRAFRHLAGQPEHARDATPQQFRTQVAQLLTRHPLTPGEEELARNPRARSAKLRAVEKLPKP